MNYHDVMFDFASKKSKDRFPCRSDMEVCAWAEAAFNHAQLDICLYIDSTDWLPLNYLPTKEALRKFTQKSWSNLRILTRQKCSGLDYIAPGGCLVTMSGIVPLRNAVGSYAQDRSKLFQIIDRNGFRLEGPLPLISFNEPKTVKKLQTAFDEAWAMAKVVV
jgi:hypothetical protein